jgi:DNA-binding sugar fermentation-stimulating protein
MKLMTLQNVVRGDVAARPSVHVKSPYVADVNIADKSIITHSASLGCCGLADKSAIVYALPIAKRTSGLDDRTCSHRICLSVVREPAKGSETVVGVYPKYAEDLAEQALVKDCIPGLQKVRVYRRETTVTASGVKSRFDFSGVDENGTPFLMEIKNVPLADYEDMWANDRKRLPADAYAGRDSKSKVAYFPEGYRKKKNAVVSPRALKHICELADIKKSMNVRCILCFVIQRDDVAQFSPSIVDPEYREAVFEARRQGVEIIAMVVKWTVVDGSATAHFVRADLPVV